MGLQSATIQPSVNTQSQSNPKTKARRFLGKKTPCFCLERNSRSAIRITDSALFFSIILHSAPLQSPAQCAAVLPHSPPAHIVPAQHPAGLPPDGTIPRTRPWSSVRF